MPPNFLADRSALARLPHPAVDRRLTPLLLAGDIASCGIVDLELLYSARTPADFRQIQVARAALPAVAIEQGDFDRAIRVMELLSRRGKHRGPSIPDLLIAAVAERAGLVVLHYDRDFDLIASMTRQAVEWVVAAGSVP
jgi:predicted nucleic acid-binding protein